MPARRPEGDLPDHGTASAADGASASPEYASRELMAEHEEIRIRHEGTLYRLRRTSSGKLILTK
jgi:hemin uptake protein HemP